MCNVRTSYYTYTRIFTDIHGKNNLSDGLVELLPSASEEIFMGKKPHCAN
jgi:hypothetical protein